MSAPTLALSSFKVPFGLMYTIIDQHIIKPIRDVLQIDKIQPLQPSAESDTTEAERIISMFRSSLERVADSKSPEHVYKRIIESLDTIWELNILANGILLQADENLIDSLKTGSESIHKILDNGWGKLPPVYMELIKHAHSTFAQSHDVYISNLECFVKSLPTAQEELGISSSDSKEQILRKALQEFYRYKQMVKQEIEQVQKNPSVETFRSPERILLISVLVHQAALFTLLDIHTEKIPAPDILIIDKLVEEATRFAELYKQTSEVFWDALLVDLYFYKLSEHDNWITGLYVGGLSRVESILVNVRRDIEPDALFKIYDLETELFDSVPNPPQIEVLFETNFIPSHFMAIPFKKFDHQVLQK